MIMDLTSIFEIALYKQTDPLLDSVFVFGYELNMSGQRSGRGQRTIQRDQLSAMENPRDNALYSWHDV